MSLHYILNKGDGQDAVHVADEREGIDAEAAHAANRFARLYRVAVVHPREGGRKEYWETRYGGRWYEIEREHLPNKLLDLGAALERSSLLAGEGGGK